MAYPYPNEIGRTLLCSVCGGETEPTYDPWTGGGAGRRCIAKSSSGIHGKCGHDGQIQEHSAYVATDGKTRCIWCDEEMP